MWDKIVAVVSSFGNEVFFGNSLLKYCIAIGSFLIGFLVLAIIKKIVLTKLQKLVAKTKFKYDDAIISAVRTQGVPLAYFIWFYICINQLKLSERVALVFKAFILIVAIFFIIRFIQSIVLFWLNNIWLKGEKASERKNTSIAIVTVLKIVLWIIGFLIFLDNMGIKISAFIAGLGIGGIAIAFAAQAVLGDIFSYFSIFFDSPFVLGDLIVIDGISGTVEHIGIKTTRLRSLTGEEVIISNTILTSSKLHNFKRMQERRIVFSLGVTYDTKADVLAQVPDIIRGIVESAPDTRFDNCRFMSFGDFSLNFEVIYYVTSGDYKIYCNTQHNINLEIKRVFDEKKIEFAFPTQTVYVAK